MAASPPQARSKPAPPLAHEALCQNRERGQGDPSRSHKWELGRGRGEGCWCRPSSSGPVITSNNLIMRLEMPGEREGGGKGEGGADAVLLLPACHRQLAEPASCQRVSCLSPCFSLAPRRAAVRADGAGLVSACRRRAGGVPASAPLPLSAAASRAPLRDGEGHHGQKESWKQLCPAWGGQVMP